MDFKRDKRFGFSKNSMLYIVDKCLRESGKPMTYEELKEAALAQGFTNEFLWNNPSVFGQRVREDISRRKGESVFQIVGLYQIGLKEWGLPDFDKSEYYRNLNEEKLANKRVTIMSAIITALEKNGEPLKMMDIYREVEKRGDIEFKSKNHFKTLNGNINHELKKKGKKSRFVRISKGLIGLRKWYEDK